MSHLISDHPMIYYGVIAFNTKILCEVDEYDDTKNSKKRNNENDLIRVGSSRKTTKKEKKYIRASKKILMKIERDEIRRPDGMSTLISGTYSYNYILGYEYCNNTNYPLLESLVFLCVLPLYQHHENNVTELDRNIAFNFLASIRRDFLTSFALNLQYIYDHQYINNFAVRIDPPSHQYITELSKKDENICTNLYRLSEIMMQRMYGNYKNKFEYKPLANSDDEQQEQQHIDDDNDNEDDQLPQDLRMPPHEESGEYINIPTPSKSMSDKTDSFMSISMPNSRDSSTINVAGAGYGSLTHPGHTNDDDDASQRSRINDFLESIVDVKEQMKERIKASMSVTSLKSLAGTEMSEDKFVEYETMPLIASTTSLIGGHGEYNRDYQTVSRRGCIIRHRKKMAIAVAVLLIIYVIVAMFCGWNVQSCASR